MHLALLISHSVSPHTIGQWRLPRSYRGFNPHDPEFWEHVARTAERGLFDMVFFADAYSLHDVYRGSPDDTIRYAVQYPRLDPLPLIPMMARAARQLGFGVTGSTSFLPPYWLARHFATLDHLTNGRIGWNIVTSYARSEAANFGSDQMIEHDDRYAVAEEYVELCNRLWGSWDDDAVVWDRENGIYADPAKVHRIDFRGAHFRCEGPLHVPPSPQRRPVMIQAGQSPRGLEFAARHAEVCFVVRHNAEGMRRHRAAFTEALAKAGRAQAPKLLWAVMPIVAETGAQALEKQRQIIAGVPIEASLAMMSGHFGVDLSQVSLDEPLANVEGAQGIRGSLAALAEDNSGGLTLRDVAQRFGAGIGPHVVGDPGEVADQLEALYDASGGDGFMLVTHALPGSVEEFVELVVPELQRRGRFRTAYAPGTLRERFLGPS